MTAMLCPLSANKGRGFTNVVSAGAARQEVRPERIRLSLLSQSVGFPQGMHP